jgi:hypothetical protein
LNPVSKFGQWRKSLAAVALHVFSMRNIIGCAHRTPEIGTSSQTGDGRNERWIVNSHLHLATWNDVYNKYTEYCIMCACTKNASRDFRNITQCIAIRMEARTQFIVNMLFSHWEPAGVSERMGSANLDASISGEYQTLGRHSCRPSEYLGAPTTPLAAPPLTVEQSGNNNFLGTLLVRLE